MRLIENIKSWLRSSTRARSFGKSDVLKTATTTAISLAAVLAAISVYPGADQYVRNLLVGLFPGLAEPIGAVVVLVFWGLRFYFSGHPVPGSRPVTQSK